MPQERDNFALVNEELRKEFNPEGEGGCFGIASEIVKPARWRGHIQVDFSRSSDNKTLIPDEIILCQEFIARIAAERGFKAKKFPKQKPGWLSYLLRPSP